MPALRGSWTCSLFPTPRSSKVWVRGPRHEGCHACLCTPRRRVEGERDARHRGAVFRWGSTQGLCTRQHSGCSRGRGAADYL
eukprot:10576195-Heterocapsa_arctica.AAC.1